MFKKFFKKDFYENLDKSYYDHLQKLENDISELKDNEKEVKKRVLQFAENFMLPKYLWNRYVQYPDYSPQLFCLSFYQFSDNYAFDADRQAFSSWRCKLLHLCLFEYHKQESNAAEYYLSYPNSQLDEAFDKFNMESNIHVSKEIVAKYRKMKTLYRKIITVLDDDEQWFQALKEANDRDFFEENVELRLGENLTNKRLWKMYLEDLKIQDTNKLLQTYSKYCRFFLDDQEMKEEYRKAAEKFNHPIKVPWKNLFSFEIYDDECIRKIIPWKFMHPDLKKVFKQKSDYISPQRFPFKKTYMHYILHSSNGIVRQKLFFSCKYFFAKLPTPVCYKLATEEQKPEFSGQSWNVLCNGMYLKQIPGDFLVKNLFVTNVLNCHSYHNQNTLSSLIPKIYQCDARFVFIRSQHLTMKKLKFLIGHGNVEELSIWHSKFFNENGEIVSLEDILEMNLKIRALSIADPSINQDTAQRMTDLNFENKFYILTFSEINNQLEPFGFAEFLKSLSESYKFGTLSSNLYSPNPDYTISLISSQKNVAIHCEINIYFKVNEPGKERFSQIITAAVNNHWKNKEKPNLKII